jgi:hypothetical protein
MAGHSHLLNRLLKVLGPFDDAALAAIASVGLVRRARKDLEKENIAIQADETSVRISVGDGIVTMTESGPADARCTCPAGGKCRHVLVAAMHLKQQPAGSPPAETPSALAAAGPSAKDELLALTEDDLSKWVGRKTLREAMRLVEGSSDIDIIEDSIECRYFPGTGLAGMVTNAPIKLRERFMAAAVLAYQRRHGVVQNIEPAASSARTVDAPRTPQQILQSASELLEEMVTVGIAHVSGSVRDRLRTLSVSCAGGNLPRLSLLLKGLADQVSMALRRDAGADDVRLFDTLARAYALCHAISAAGDSPSPALVGQSRSRYDQGGALELAGVGAYAWRTRSGYHGLTVLFWDSVARRWCSWSDSRPVAQDASFNPVARYEPDLPWQGSGSARIMSRSRFRLSGASRNEDDRLSGSEQCRAVILDDTDPAAIDFGSRAFDDWAALRSYLASITPAGLETHSPLDRVVVLKPATWGPRAFLPAEQTLVWALLDPHGQAVLLTLPFDAVSQRAVESLEAIDPAIDQPWVVGTVHFDGTQVRLFPFSLLRKTAAPRIQNLNLDASPASAHPARAHASAPPTPAAGPADADQTGGAALAPLFAQWSGLEDDLQRWAESGTRRITPPEIAGLQSAAAAFTDRGMAPLAACIRQATKSQPPASALLRLHYLCMLYRELAIRSILCGTSG